jgi:hypothetical protein
MKDVEYFTFIVPPDIWRKKASPYPHKMSMEDAERRFPGATPILSSREVRRLPATEAEIRAEVMKCPQGYSGINKTEVEIGRRIQEHDKLTKVPGGR